MIVLRFTPELLNSKNLLVQNLVLAWSYIFRTADIFQPNSIGGCKNVDHAAAY